MSTDAKERLARLRRLLQWPGQEMNKHDQLALIKEFLDLHERVERIEAALRGREQGGDPNDTGRIRSQPNAKTDQEPVPVAPGGSAEADICAKCGLLAAQEPSVRIRASGLLLCNDCHRKTKAAESPEEDDDGGEEPARTLRWAARWIDADIGHMDQEQADEYIGTLLGTADVLDRLTAERDRYREALERLGGHLLTLLKPPHVEPTARTMNGWLDDIARALAATKEGER